MLATGSLLKRENKEGLSAGSLKLKASHSKLFLYEITTLQSGPLISIMHTQDRPCFFPFLTAHLSLVPLACESRVHQSRPALIQPHSIHFNHQSELSVLCHLTAFSPSEARKATLNASQYTKIGSMETGTAVLIGSVCPFHPIYRPDWTVSRFLIYKF